MFAMFNQMWGEAGKPYSAHLYHVVGMGQGGVIQCIPKCKPAREWEKGRKWQLAFDVKSAQDMSGFVNSAVGAFVASYALGARDRHQDNILVVEDCKQLAMIDYDHLWNRVPVTSLLWTFDLSIFAVPPGLKAALIERQFWEIFVDECIDAFRVLREKFLLIKSVASRLFDPSKLMDDHLQRIFLPDRRAGDAASLLQSKIGVRNVRGAIKDGAHNRRQEKKDPSQ